MTSHVLIIESLPIMRYGLLRFINCESGFTVCGEASDITDVQTIMKECQPDIIITDLSPKMGININFINTITKRFANIPVLVFSAQNEIIFADRCLKAGARGYLMKSESPEEIITALKKILKGGVYVSAQVEHNLLCRFINDPAGIEKPAVDTLSNRELEVFHYLGQGLKAKEMANELNLSVKTIGTHMDRIRKKMNLRNSREVFMHAVQWSTLDLHRESG